MKPQEIRNKTILIAPLDWGMGHVTRSLALMKIFIENENQVVFAGTNEQINIAKQDFPNLIYELIEGYGIKLDSTKSTYWQMFLQSTKMQSRIKKEAGIAAALVAKHSIDVIISDNRYGFKAVSCLNIILTHQLSPPIPNLRKAVTAQLTKWVNGFNFCWIPDDETSPICSELADVVLKIPKIEIGFLSRMIHEDLEKSNEILFISSGPEPERSRFEKLVIALLVKSNKPFKVVGQSKMTDEFYLHNPSATELQNLINTSGLIISRAGYTTIMELICLKANAILIPTKGQFEQEYLAKTVVNNRIKFMDEIFLNQNFTSLVD